MSNVLQISDGVVSFDVLVQGSKIKDTVEVSEITIQAEVNRIAFATVVIEDGGLIGASNVSFDNSESKDFLPGNDIEISLGYDNSRKTAFKGIIVSHKLSVKQGKSQLIVTCKDKAVKMTRGRKNAIFQKKKDSDIIKSIAGNYPVSAKVTATTTVMPIMTQYNCTDWDFIVARAEANNMIVLTDQNEISVDKLDFSGSVTGEINATQSIIDIDLGIDGEDIADSHDFSSWDDKTQEQTKASVKANDKLKQGNVALKNLSSVVQTGASVHYSSAPLAEAELKSWGESFSSKAVLTKVKGTVTVQGTTQVKTADLVKISGFSERFNGNAFVSKVNHSLRDGEWRTTFTLGKSFTWHTSIRDVRDIEASGLLPSADGIQIGKVKKIDEDPDGNLRVQVTLPAFTGEGQSDGIWARIAFPYASNEAGFFFYPEIDDEVVLSFVNNDPRFPIITGALYSGKAKAKETPDKDNQFKSIHTKSGILLRFDDKDKIVTLETPGGNSIVLDDKAKKITITDLNKNSCTMSDSGIALDSPKDIKISSKGNIDISATANLTLSAKSDVKVDGTNIQQSAKVGFTAKGNASAEVSASGQTTIKGAMVMIN